MKLRILESDDINIRKIMFQSDEANEYLKHEDENEYLTDINKTCIGELIVNDDNGELIGKVFVYKKKYPGFIFNVETKPKYRGKGFGKMLVDDAVKKLGGYDLTVNKTNYRAIQLYKDYGFEIISDGNDESEYYMKLEKIIFKKTLDKSE